MSKLFRHYPVLRIYGNFRDTHWETQLKANIAFCFIWGALKVSLIFVCFFFRFSVHLVFCKRDAMVFHKLGEGYSYYFNLSLQRFISKFCRPLFLSGRTPVNNKMLHDQIESLTLKEMFTVLFKIHCCSRRD